MKQEEYSDIDDSTIAQTPNFDVTQKELRQFYLAPLERTLGIPFTFDNRLTILKNGDKIFSAMLDAIANSRSSIEFLTYIYWSGPIAQQFTEALCAAAKRNVEVHVLLDAFGATWMSEELIAQLQNSGVRLEFFRPKAHWKLWRVTHRTHRKILVCDSKIGFTGGVGIAQEWTGDAKGPDEWRDTHFQIEGPAVAGLEAAFIGNWLEAGESIQEFAKRAVENVILESNNASKAPHWHPHYTKPFDNVPALVLRSSANLGWSDMATLFRTLLAIARRELLIQTAYFTPDDRAIELLRSCVSRGVTIDIMIPGKHIDQRVSRIVAEASLEPLLDAGIRIWRYEKTMLHTKIYIVDRMLACIGSPNFNFRSMREDDEISVTIASPEVCATLIDHFNEDLSNAVEYHSGQWKKRSLVKRATENIVHAFRRGL